MKRALLLSTAPVFALMLLALNPSVSQAEWHAKLSIESAWESNIFLDSTPESDLATETGLRVAHGWTLQPWAFVVAWEGNLTTFTEHADNNYLLHSIQVTAQRQLDSTHWIRWGGRSSWRADREASALYDYREYGAFMEARPPVVNGLGVATGYNISHRAYEIMEGADHTEHLLYGRVQLPLEGGTSVTLSTEAGYRQYGDSAHDPAGAGHGANGQSASASGDGSGVGQWLNSLNFSTPLFDERSGLQMYARLRNNFDGGQIPGSGTRTVRYAGDELFDDRYGYESREIGGTVSRVVFTAVTARIGYDHSVKEYFEPARTAEGSATGTAPGRQDTWQCLSFRIEKRFGKPGSPNRPLLYGQYRRTWNSSNDLEYRYAASTAAIGMEMTW